MFWGVRSGSRSFDSASQPPAVELRDALQCPIRDKYANRTLLDPITPLLNILLICNYDPYQAATVQDHIKALNNYSAHNCFIYSGLGELPEELCLEKFDVIVCHYSITVANDAYLGPISRFRIRTYRGLKALFIQDEYRHVNATIEAIEYLGIHLIFTCLAEAEWEKVYPKARLPKVERVNVFTGYVPQHLVHCAVPRTCDRPIDVGYRGRRYPAWHGALGRERTMIAERFKPAAVAEGLVCDIAMDERARLYGQQWIHFLTRCKAVLGTESGSSVFDFTGEVARSVKEHSTKHPDTTYDELRALYFREHEGRIYLNQISPRCFEAIALKTLLILYEGRYSGVLTPEKHYVTLRKDHSNLADVIRIIKDPRKVEEIIECAYSDIAMSTELSYQSFIQRVDRKLSEAAAGRVQAAPPYAKQEFVATFGRFDTPLRWHVIKSRIVVSSATLANERILPMLPPKAAAVVKSCASATLDLLGHCKQWWKHKCLARFDVKYAMEYTMGSREVNRELRELQSRCQAAAAISSAIGRHTLTVSLDRSAGVVTITPDTESIGKDARRIDISEFSDALRKSNGTRVLWIPGSRLGLCGPLRACEPEELYRVSNAIHSGPELFQINFWGSAAIFVSADQSQTES